MLNFHGRAIKLPVAALLKQFKEFPNVSLIRHFDLLYIRHGIGRLSADERLLLLPVLVRGLSQDIAANEAHGAHLLHLFFRLLGDVSLASRGTKEDQELRSKLGLTAEDASCLSQWCGKLILLQNTTAADAAARPGLSARDYRILTVQGKQDAWNTAAGSGLSLTETKIKAMRFAASGAFTDDERFFPALFASADSNSRLSELGEDVLKRAVASIDLEDAAVVDQLYTIYLGR